MAVYRMHAMRKDALARRAVEPGDKSAPAWDGLANALTAVGMDRGPQGPQQGCRGARAPRAAASAGTIPAGSAAWTIDAKSMPCGSSAIGKGRMRRRAAGRR